MLNFCVTNKVWTNKVRFVACTEWESGLERAIVTLLDDLAQRRLPSRPPEDILHSVYEYLPGILTTQRFDGLDEENAVVKETWEKLYPDVLSALIGRIDTAWPLDTNGLLDTYCACIFAPDGASPQMLLHSLKTLTSALESTPLSRRCDAVVALLIHLVHSSAIFSATLRCCIDHSVARDPIHCHFLRETWEDCVRIIVSLPNRIANKLKHNAPPDVLPSKFSKILCFHIACCVSYISNSERPTDFVPLSILLNRVLVDFHDVADSGVIILVRALIEWCAMDLMKARTVVPMLLRSINKGGVESVSELILRESFDLGVKVENVIGKAVLESSDWKYVLCTKIPLLKYSDYSDSRVLTALAHYLGESCEFRPLLKDLLLRLLSVWSDRSALLHTPLEQHIYITQALILCSISFHFTDKEQYSPLALKCLFLGVQVHLESPVVQVRAIGMITAEILSKHVANMDTAEIKFDYSGFDKTSLDLIEMVRNLSVNFKPLPSLQEEGNTILISFARKCSLFGLACQDRDKVVEYTVKSPIVYSPLLCAPSEETVQNDEALDSDDDLEPFDLSNDKPLADRKKPVYLRDMLEGLNEVEDMDRWSGSLIVCEDLVQKQMPQEDTSLAFNLLDALVALEPRFPLQDFSQLQLRGAVAVVCSHPSSCADYLSKLFHKESRTYSIQQRLFMLHVLTEAAQQLSSIPHSSSEEHLNTSVSATPPSTSWHQSGYMEEVLNEFSNLFPVETGTPKEQWKIEIDKRVAAKTHRISSKTRLPLSYVSRFAPVAGSFFFPWIRGLKQSCGTVALTLQEETHIDDDLGLLLRFILSLSVVMQCSSHAPVAPRIGAELLELAWSIRYHVEASIRLAAIGCVMSVLFAVPESRLLGDLRPSLVETREWLHSIVFGPLGVQDTNLKCRELGGKVGAMLDALFS